MAARIGLSPALRNKVAQMARTMCICDIGETAGMPSSDSIYSEMERCPSFAKRVATAQNFFSLNFRENVADCSNAIRNNDLSQIYIELARLERGLSNPDQASGGINVNALTFEEMDTLEALLLKAQPELGATPDAHANNEARTV